MDEQKPLENKQGEPGKKIEKSEYSFMQETIKDENSRGKKCRKDLLRMAGLGVVNFEDRVISSESDKAG